MAPPELIITGPDLIEEEPPISVPDTGDAGESGKLKMIVQLVKKCLGVKDIASMRLSLPASLLEPIPNLEYWHYLDRPDLFAAINDSEDEFERMLAVVRFTFSKELKFIRGKLCKPYNSVLGEHFRSHWDVIPVSYPTDASQPPIQHLFVSHAAPPSPLPPATIPPSGTASPRLGASETASIRSEKSARSANASVLSLASRGGKSTTTAASSPLVGEANLEARMSQLDLMDDDADEDSDSDLVEADEAPGAASRAARVRIAFLTEQVSHHPPVSAYFAACPARGIEMGGVDQIAARVSGTTLRIASGELNQGIFVHLTAGPGADEQYQITHPVAAVNGILRGSFYATLGDATIITCSGGKDGKKLRAVIEYKEESWLGRAVYLVEGVIHTYTPGESGVDEWTRVKHVPKARALAYIDGSWRHLLRWRRASDKDWTPLLDLSTLHIIPKTVRPLERQDANESRKLWDNVTTRLLSKEFGEATKHKQAIEQRQRDEAAERKRKGIEFQSVYFEKDISSGIPTLTVEGRKAIDNEFKEDSPYTLESSSKAKLAP